MDLRFQEFIQWNKTKLTLTRKKESFWHFLGSSATFRLAVGKTVTYTLENLELYKTNTDFPFADINYYVLAAIAGNGESKTSSLNLLHTKQLLCVAWSAKRASGSHTHTHARIHVSVQIYAPARSWDSPPRKRQRSSGRRLGGPG